MFPVYVNDINNRSVEKFRSLINDYNRHLIFSISRPKTKGNTGTSPFAPLRGQFVGVLQRVRKALEGDKATPIYAIVFSDEVAFLLHIGTPTTSIAAAVLKLSAVNGVRWPEPDTRLAFSVLPVADPLRPQQWALDQIEVPAAWARLAEETRRSVKIAIVDWGVFCEHEDFKRPASEPRLISGYRVIPPFGGSFDDDNGHGTLLTGTVAAVAGNSAGLEGMVQKSEILALKFADVRTVPTAFAAATAVLLAIWKGAKVINASWDVGIDEPDLLRRMIRYAGDCGVTVVAAAGNSGRDNARDPILPASYGLPNIISVMASDAKGRKPGFSNYGDNVDIAAPGLNVVSTYPYFRPEPGHDPVDQPPVRPWRTNRGYHTYSGTSAAAAHVSGAVALMLSLDPGLTPCEIREHLIASATSTPDLQGMCRAGGYLNLRRAIMGPFVVTKPTGGERLRRGAICDVTWHSEYQTPLVTKRLLSVFDLNAKATVGNSVEVGASGRIRLQLPEGKIERAAVRIASDPPRFYAHSKPFSVI